MRVMRKRRRALRCAHVYVSPLIDSEGRQTGWMASMNDITEPKRARAELEASHERFVAVLDGLDAAVYVADVANTTRSSSPTGLQGASTVSMPSARTAGSHLRTAIRSAASMQADPRRLGLDDLPRELFDGELQPPLSGRWYHLRDRAIRWVDGRIVRMAIATDITDRKLIEEANLQHQERLQQTSRLITMGEMASSLAHELNQPLSAIANYCMGSVNRLQVGRVPRRRTSSPPWRRPAPRPSGPARSSAAREFVKKSEPQRAPVALAEIVEDAIGFAEIEARKAGGQPSASTFRRAAAGVRRPHHDRAGGAQPGEERHRSHAAGAGRSSAS
jgi:PAS domain-containing protein